MMYHQQQQQHPAPPLMHQSSQRLSPQVDLSQQQGLPVFSLPYSPQPLQQQQPCSYATQQQHPAFAPQHAQQHQMMLPHMSYGSSSSYHPTHVQQQQQQHLQSAQPSPNSATSVSAHLPMYVLSTSSPVQSPQAANGSPQYVGGGTPLQSCPQTPHSTNSLPPSHHPPQQQPMQVIYFQSQHPLHQHQQHLLANSTASSPSGTFVGGYGQHPPPQQQQAQLYNNTMQQQQSKEQHHQQAVVEPLLWQGPITPPGGGIQQQQQQQQQQASRHPFSVGLPTMAPIVDGLSPGSSASVVYPHQQHPQFHSMQSLGGSTVMVFEQLSVHGDPPYHPPMHHLQPTTMQPQQQRPVGPFEVSLASMDTVMGRLAQTARPSPGTTHSSSKSTTIKTVGSSTHYPAEGSLQASMPSTSSSTTAPPVSVCRHFMEGKCNRRKCRFMHAVDAHASAQQLLSDVGGGSGAASSDQVVQT